MKNPLQDKEFLYNLNQDRHKEIYAKIISLSFDEKPLEQIEGRVTSGSINIDGTSTVRRTCNLTLIAKDVNITDFYWGVSNKFTLEIGLKNNINKEYPNIIWFKQGIYVITSFNSSCINDRFSCLSIPIVYHFFLFCNSMRWCLKIQLDELACILLGYKDKIL